MTATLQKTRWLPGRPVAQFAEQLIFLGTVWAGFALATFALTAIVSIFNEIDYSGWAFTSGAVRWYAFAIACYFGYTVLPLHVLHGQTRRACFIRLIAFLPLYAAAIAALHTLTYAIEAGFYALAGWQQGTDGGALYATPLEMPAIFIESWMILLVWTAGGVMVSTGFYRSGLLGAVAIVIALIFAAVSSAALGGDQLPFGIDNLFLGPTSLPVVVAAHLAAFAALMAMAWLIVRHMPIQTKAESS